MPFKWSISPKFLTSLRKIHTSELTSGRKKIQKNVFYNPNSSKVSSGISRANALQAYRLRREWELEENRCQQLNSAQSKECFDDVYFVDQFFPRSISLEECLSEHREFVVSPEMLNCPEAAVTALFQLNCRTNKKKRFIQRLPIIAVPPHQLDFLPARQVLALCQIEDVEAAKKAGAFEAGGADLIEKLKRGVVHYESFDSAVAHSSLVKEIGKMKSTFRDKLPSLAGKSMGPNVEELVTLFRLGLELNLVKSEAIPEIGHIRITLGKIGWPNMKIRENFDFWTEKIFQSLNGKIAGEVFESVHVLCPPSDERIRVKLHNVDFLKAKYARISSRASVGDTLEDNSDVEEFGEAEIEGDNCVHVDDESIKSF